MRSRKTSRGIALITALLVMALAAIAAAAVLGSANAAIRRTATLIDNEKAWWYATGVESWVLTILARDRKDNDIDSLDEKWNQKLDFLPVEQGGLSGGLEDLQGRFNLNNLGSSKAKLYAQQFQRLFRHIEGVDPALAAPLAEAIQDWIDGNPVPNGAGGAEDNDYMSLEQPYRAANQDLRSPSELLAIKGMTRETYLALAPYVAALPLDGSRTPTRINVNTAALPVLLALSENADPSKLKIWEEKRLKEPVDNVQKLQADQTLPADVTPDLVDTRSSFFLMKATAFIGSGRVALYSVVRRPASGTPIVIARSLDTE